MDQKLFFTCKQVYLGEECPVIVYFDRLKCCVRWDLFVLVLSLVKRLS